MAGKLIEINLFGACSINSVEGGFSISSPKHKALFALLVTAPFGRRTRSFLQETLWGQACYDTGRQSLRRALSDIKALMGDDYAAIISGNNSDLIIDLTKVQFVGSIAAGPFLEGLDVRETGFARWLTGIRQNPRQLASLFGLASRSSLHATLPAVAVLPFRAIGGDPSDPVLGDWLAEETSRSLSRSRLIAVISHLSCRQLSLGVIDMEVIRDQLSVDFCVVGSLRRTGGKIVLDADFVDARSGRILWTRQFAEDAERFLAQSGSGISRIVEAIGSAIAEDTLSHVRGLVPAEIEDHRLIVAGVSLMHRSTLRDFARARELIDEALRRDPDAAEAHAWLGKWYVLSVFNGWSTDASHETQMALDCTARALDISPDNSFCLTIDGFAQSNLARRLDIADLRYDAAVTRNPNEALAWLLKGAMHTFRSDGAEAVNAAKRARALSPIDPFSYFYDALTAGSYLCNGDYEQALHLADKSISVNDRHLSTLRIKLFALHFLGRQKEAASVGSQLMLRQPDFCISTYMRHHPSADFRMGKMMAQAMGAAGIPSGE
jgi:TolB-like protein